MIPREIDSLKDAFRVSNLDHVAGLGSVVDTFAHLLEVRHGGSEKLGSSHFVWTVRCRKGPEKGVQHLKNLGL